MKKRIVYPLMIATIIGSGGFLVSSFKGNSHSDNIKVEAATYDSTEVVKNTDFEKLNIQNLMLNSIDNYRSAEGSFTYYSSAGRYHLYIDYKVNLNENPQSYEKVQSIEFNPQENSFKTASFESGYEESIYDGDSLINFNNKLVDSQANGTVQSVKVRPATKEEREFKKGTTMKERVIPMLDGEKSYIRRVDPSLMGIAKTSLFPEDIAMGFLENTVSWNITGEGNISGLKTFVIQGTLNKDYTTRYNAQDFLLEVDQKTGILLKMEVTDYKGNIKESIITNEIKLNEELSPSLFKLS